MHYEIIPGPVHPEPAQLPHDMHYAASGMEYHREIKIPFDIYCTRPAGDPYLVTPTYAQSSRRPLPVSGYSDSPRTFIWCSMINAGFKPELVIINRLFDAGFFDHAHLSRYLNAHPRYRSSKLLTSYR